MMHQRPRAHQEPPQPAAHSFAIRLGWPARELSPNARVDRRIATSARQTAKMEAWAELKRIRAQISANAHIEIVFHPPDQRRRDLDNLLASLKSHLDGLALAADVDDSGWSFTIRKGTPVAGGCVIVDVFNGGLQRP